MTPAYFPLDARIYVREELELRQKRRPHYSLRAFARDLEISPSFLCEFLAGRQGFSRARAIWIANKLNLTDEQRDHFWDLIQAKFAHPAPLKHAAAFRAMQRAKSKPSHLELERFHLIADWYHFVLLEILGLKNGPKSLEEISTLIQAPKCDLEQALSRLEKLGFLKVSQPEDQNHLPRYELLTDMTSVGDEVPDRAVQLCHQQALRMQADAIETKSFAERENVTIVFSTRKDKWPDLRKEVQKAIIDVCAKYAEPSPENDQVVTLSAQWMTLI